MTDYTKHPFVGYAIWNKDKRQLIIAGFKEFVWEELYDAQAHCSEESHECVRVKVTIDPEQE